MSISKGITLAPVLKVRKGREGEGADNSCRYLAGRLDVSPSTLNPLLKQQSGVSPEMALRLSKALGRTPESWLAMQDMYDLWVAEKSVKLDKVQNIELDAS